MKRCKKLCTLICIALVAVMCLSACTTATPTLTPDNTTEATPTPTPTPTPNNTETPTPPAPPTPTPVPTFPISSAQISDYLSGFEGYFSAPNASQSGADNDAKKAAAKEVKKLFDGDKNTDMVLTFAEGQEKSITLAINAVADKMIMNAYSFTVSATNPNETPNSWQVFGQIRSTGDWIRIDNVTDAKMSTESNATSRLFVLDVPGNFSNIKFVFSNDTVRFAEIKAYGDANYFNWTGNDYDWGIANNYVDSRSIKLNGEAVENGANMFTEGMRTIDGVNFTVDTSKPVEISWDMAAPVIVTAYDFKVQPGQLKPKAWELYGITLDGEEILIDTQTSLWISPANGAAGVSRIQKPGAFRSYKWVITEFTGSGNLTLHYFHLLRKKVQTPIEFNNYELLTDLVNPKGTGKEIGKNENQYINEDFTSFDHEITTGAGWSINWFKEEDMIPFTYVWTMKEPVTLEAYYIDNSYMWKNAPKSWKLYAAPSEFSGLDEYVLIDEVKDAALGQDEMHYIKDPQQYQAFRLVIEEGTLPITRENLTIGEIYLLGSRG